MLSIASINILAGNIFLLSSYFQIFYLNIAPASIAPAAVWVEFNGKILRHAQRHFTCQLPILSVVGFAPINHFFCGSAVIVADYSCLALAGVCLFAYRSPVHTCNKSCDAFLPAPRHAACCMTSKSNWHFRPDGGSLPELVILPRLPRCDFLPCVDKAGDELSSIMQHQLHGRCNAPACSSPFTPSSSTGHILPTWLLWLAHFFRRK